MIKWAVILNIAKTHLLTKFKQTSTAALGVTFGIGAYITLVCFMTGLNKMLDDLILNQTPHIHIYNEIEPSKQQAIDLYDEFRNSFNVVHSIKPKQTQSKIHNALPIIENLNKDENVKGAIPQLKTQIFYIAGTIEIGGNLTGILPMEESRLFNFHNYIIEGSPEALYRNDDGILLGRGIAQKMSLKLGDRVQISTIEGQIFPLKIVGFFQSGIADIDNIQSFTNLKTVQRIKGEPENYITDINVKLFDISKALG
ncbi:MAG: ABC transporter permease, partial [Bacteroidia bacterium]|nr:ABC transporter permease [Bacteroidia bacterium]